jgi:hypothetical protein
MWVCVFVCVPVRTCVRMQVQTSLQHEMRQVGQVRPRVSPRFVSTLTLKWATLGPMGSMQEGTGSHGQHGGNHVILFAMHNEISRTFRDSIRIRALLETTAITHVSSMNQNLGAHCMGHNCVQFKQAMCPELRQGCPPLVLWDYNFAFDAYVLSNYGGNLFSEQVPGYFCCGAHMVVIPNWGKQTIHMLHGTTARLNRDSQQEQSFARAMHRLDPLMEIQVAYLSAREAETHHPLVAATITAEHTLVHSSDVSARAAGWENQQRWIGVEVAFIILYNVEYIRNPLMYLKALCTKH